MGGPRLSAYELRMKDADGGGKCTSGDIKLGVAITLGVALVLVVIALVLPDGESGCDSKYC